MDFRWRPNTVRVRLADGAWVELHTKRERCRPLPDHAAFIRGSLAAMVAAADVRVAGVPVDLTSPEGWAQLPPEVTTEVYTQAVRKIVTGWKDPESVKELLDGS
jgi:hypothetical protein